MISWKDIEEAQKYHKGKRLEIPTMKITIENGKDGFTRVYCGDKFSGVMKYKDKHFLCYSKGRHTTTENLTEVIRFFNGDFNSYYYRGNER